VVLGIHSPGAAAFTSTIRSSSPQPQCTSRPIVWRSEGWTIIQALYFSVVTLTTVGYGDFTPTSAGTQIFTIIYIFTGLGVFVALLASVAAQYIAQKTEGGSPGERLRARRHRGRTN